MKISRIGVDLAKNVFQLHGADVIQSRVTDTPVACLLSV